MDWTEIAITLIVSIFGGGGTIAAVLGAKKARDDKAAENELEANKLVVEHNKLASAEEDKTWARQAEQFAALEKKLKDMDQRLTTVEQENSALRSAIVLKDRTLQITELWAVKFVFNVQQAGQDDLIPVPWPEAVSAYFPPASSN